MTLIRDVRQTHTVVTLEVSRAVYDEIREKLEAAGYDHVFMRDGLMDMNGIALGPPEGGEHA